MGKSVLIALALLVFAGEELLHAPYELSAPHGFVPPRDLGEAIRTFDPVAAAIVRSCVLGTQIERNRWRLPCKMKPNALSRSSISNFFHELSTSILGRLKNRPARAPTARSESKVSFVVSVE